MKKIHKILLILIISVFLLNFIILISKAFGLDEEISWFLKLNEDAKRLSDIKKIRKALDLYYKDHKRYPSIDAICSSWLSTEKNYLPELEPYLKEQPHDPIETSKKCPDYCYQGLQDGSDYKLIYYFKTPNPRAIGIQTSLCGNYFRYEFCKKDLKCEYFNSHYTAQIKNLSLENDKKRLKDIAKIKKALEEFYKIHQHYPKSSIICSSWTEEKNYIPALKGFLKEQPHDPIEKPKSLPDYCYISNGKTYELIYYLKNELKENPGVPKPELGKSGEFKRYAICGKEGCLK